MKNLNKIVDWLLNKALYAAVIYICVNIVNYAWGFLPYTVKYNNDFANVATVVIIMLMIPIANKITPWLVNLYKKAMELGMNFGLKIRAKFVK